MNATIMLVDDDPAIERLISAMLRDAPGIRLVYASNAAEAVRLAGEHQPELVLMDIRLPDVDGIEIARRLRADPEHAGMRIVACTGTAPATHLARVDFDDYLGKPF